MTYLFVSNYLMYEVFGCKPWGKHCGKKHTDPTQGFEWPFSTNVSYDSRCN